MKNKMILVSGLPASGKTTFAKWLSAELRIPHVCYDNILEKTMEIGRCQCEDEEQVRKYYGEFPYSFFLFSVEEIMKSSSLFVVDYHFADMMNPTLDELTTKYQYETITVHMDCPAELAFSRWAERNKVNSMRPDLSEDQFIQGVKQNKEFRYGSNFIYVDTIDFSAVSYKSIAEQIRQYTIR